MKFTTGRNYGIPQVLDITVEAQGAPDEFGLVNITASFTDASRNISGRVSTLILSPDDMGPAVLSAYDAGKYSLI